MGIINIQLHPYRIPMRGQFVTAHSAQIYREGAIVEIQTREGCGLGEIAPLTDFTGTTLQNVLDDLQHTPFMRKAMGKPVYKVLNELLTEAAHLPASAVCGLESALLDILGQGQSRTISSLLARDSHHLSPKIPIAPTTLPVLTRKSIPINKVVGASTTAEAVEKARNAVSQGFRCIKLKVGQGVEEDIERITEIRKAIGPDVALRLDANEGWSSEQAMKILRHCAGQDIQYVEQPLPAKDLTGMRKLREAVRVPLAADEAVYDLASARRVLSAEAADILILKPQLAGGLCICRQIIREALKYGVRCVVTSAIECGIGVVGAVHLVAASPEIKLACGLGTLDLLEDDLLQETLTIRNGHIVVPILPGLGVKLDRTALRKYSYHLES